MRTDTLHHLLQRRDRLDRRIHDEVAAILPAVRRACGWSEAFDSAFQRVLVDGDHIVLEWSTQGEYEDVVERIRIPPDRLGDPVATFVHVRCRRPVYCHECGLRSFEDADECMVCQGREIEEAWFSPDDRADELRALFAVVLTVAPHRAERAFKDLSAVQRSQLTTDQLARMLEARDREVRLLAQTALPQQLDAPASDPPGRSR